MATLEERLETLENQMQIAITKVQALEALTEHMVPLVDGKHDWTVKEQEAFLLYQYNYWFPEAQADYDMDKFQILIVDSLNKEFRTDRTAHEVMYRLAQIYDKPPNHYILERYMNE